MAKTNGDAHQPILPQLGQDSERTPKGPTPRHPIDKTALERMIENKMGRIKIKGNKSPFHHIPIAKTHEAFCFLPH
jgi:hypothetical protein